MGPLLKEVKLRAENPFNSRSINISHSRHHNSIIIKIVFHLRVLYIKGETQLGSIFIKVQMNNNINSAGSNLACLICLCVAYFSYSAREPDLVSNQLVYGLVVSL
jgi:hypothetical protein